jgi:Holliday junction resolvase
MRESEIQHKIITYLEKLGFYVVKIIQTNKNGWPDIQAHKKGETIFIEVKNEKGIVSELQKYRHKQLTEQGFKVIIATNLKNIQDAITN